MFDIVSAVTLNPDTALAEFFSAFKVKTASDDPSVILQRDLEIIRQEYREVHEALGYVQDELLDGTPGGSDYEQHAAEALKELADLVYVAFHAARSLGYDLMPVLEEVHRSNMTKVCKECGEPHRDKIGKVLKTVSGYRPADVLSLVRVQNSGSVDTTPKAA